MLREILVSGLREYLAEHPHRTAGHAARQMEDRLPDGRDRHAARRQFHGALVHLPFLPVTTIGEVMLWVAAALTLWTGWDYLTAGVRHAYGTARRGTAQAPASLIVRVLGIVGWSGSGKTTLLTRLIPLFAPAA